MASPVDFSLLNHSSRLCRRYSNYFKQKHRAEELGLCCSCLSVKHTKKKCPAINAKLPFAFQSCKTTSHVTPMCPDTPLSFAVGKSIKEQGENICLTIPKTSAIVNPVANIIIKSINNCITVPVLLDTGAQSSIINEDLLSAFTLEKTVVHKPISSLFIKDSIYGYESKLDIILPVLDTISSQFLFLPNFGIDMEVKGMNNLLKSLEQASCAVSLSMVKSSNDKLTLYCILGNDIIQYFKVFKLCDLFGGKMLRLTNGFISVGTISRFNLTPGDPNCRFKSTGERGILLLTNKFSGLSELASNLTADSCNHSVTQREQKVGSYLIDKDAKKSFTTKHRKSKREKPIVP